MWSELCHNTGEYVRLILRRDRMRIPIWLIALTLLTMLVAFAYTQLAPSVAERQMMAETMDNPAVTAMFGPAYGLDDYNFGVMMGHQMLLFTSIAVAIMNILFVARHTRGDEEKGRIEMLRSLPVGRLSNVSGVGLVALGTNAFLAILIGAGLYVMNIANIDLGGSLLYGALLGSAGIFFAGITALCAQISDNYRGTVGLSFALLILTYLIRGIGDVGNEALSWLSPFGWLSRSQVYLNNYLWPVLLTVFVGAVIYLASLYLNSIRDLKAGFMPTRPGRTHASSFLQIPLGLTVRLQQSTLIAWAAGVFVLGASYGSVLGDLEAYLETMDLIQLMLVPVEGYSLTEQFLPMLMSVISIVCAIPALLAILRLVSEENDQRTENLLARAVSRNNLMGSYLLVAIVASAAMQMFAVTGMWSAASAVMEEPVSFELLFNASMVYLPAIWVMIGVAALFIGFAPRAATIVWVYLGYSFVVVYMGGLLQLPEWMSTLSPFGAVPQLPVEDINVVSLMALTTVALLLSVAGFVGFNRRDMKG